MDLTANLGRSLRHLAGSKEKCHIYLKQIPAVVASKATLDNFEKMLSNGNHMIVRRKIIALSSISDACTVFNYLAESSDL